MRLGSVEFFKVLIKTVLLIIFVVPLIIAIIFGIILLNKNKEIDDLNKENAALNIAADVLSGEKAGTAEDFNLIFERSGVSYDDLMKLLYEKGKLDSQSVYNILSNAGVSDRELIFAAINKNGTDADSLHATLKGAGLTDAQIAAVAELAQKSLQSKPPIISSQNTQSASSTSGSQSSSTVSDSTSTSSSSNDSSTSDTSTPVPVDKEYLSKYPDMYVNVPTDYVRETGTVYLTFDDGPSDNIYTVLWILRQRGVKATFFVTPKANSNVTAKLKAIAADGHTIGIHSATHDYAIYESVDAFLDDFYEAWNIVREATGIETPVFRFPGGSKNDYNVDTRDEIIEEMTRRGFRYYDWNVQSNDILGHNWTQMYNTILNGVRNSNRSIVLFHDRADNGVNVLDDIIKVLQDEGHKFDKINDDTMPYQFIGPFS